MSDAFSGGLSFKIGDGGDPETFTTVGEVYNVSGIGVSKEQIKVSSFDSTSNHEYIAAYLADGAEITVDCNLILSETQQTAMLAKVDASENGNVEFALTNGTETLTFGFNAAFLGYTVTPAFEDRNTLSFTLKISGAITRTTA